MFVSDWMTRTVITIAPDDSISDVVKLMKEPANSATSSQNSSDRSKM